MLNKWDGGLTIDEKNGTILASMVGAGIKDENNTFSGVLMGDITQAFDDNHNGLGLYGFHQNDQSFGFNIDGTAFIGKAGHGRIWFNGNDGKIFSGAYSDGVSSAFKEIGTGYGGNPAVIRPQQGMEIDLDGSDGISSSLKMFGPYGGLVVDTKSKKIDDYWKVKSGKAKPTDSERTITFKLFTGTYKNKEVPDVNKGEFKNENLPYERGMLYFDNDGQYIQSTNYNGKYNVEAHKAHSNDITPIGLNPELKFGKFPAGLSGQNIPPGWHVWKLNDKGKVAGNITSYGDTPADAGSFIDLRNGWIDMRNGIVGGWQISKDMIASRLGEVIMWSGDPSDSSDAGVPFIRIGAIRDKVMKGKLWIADYRIKGQTGSGDITATTITAGDLTLSSDGYIGYDGKVNEDTQSEIEDIIAQQSVLTDTKFSTSALNSWSLIDDTDDNQGKNLGVILETASGSGGGGSAIEIWRPTSSSSSVIASLGTTSYPWTNIYAKNGIFMYENFSTYPSGSSEGWHLVATQEWVTKVIMAALNVRIKEVNNLAAKAYKKARRAISNILSWCKEWDGTKFITAIKPPENSALAVGGIMDVTYGTVVSNVSEDGDYTGTMTIKETVEQVAMPFVSLAYFFAWLAQGFAPLEERVEKLEEQVEQLKTNQTTLAKSILSLATHKHTFSGSDSDKHSHTVSGAETSKETVRISISGTTSGPSYK